MDAAARFEQIYRQQANMNGGVALGGVALGGKMSKKGIKLRDKKSARPAARKMSTKQSNPWLEYVALERNKAVNAHLSYKEILQNIDRDAYARWKKKHYPGAPEAVLAKPKRRVAKPKALAIKPKAKKAAPKKKVLKLKK